MVLLTILVPGGPVETRGFTHINPKILSVFNVFLTSVGIISLLLIYFVFKNQKWSYLMSFFCGLTYFIIYAIDLGDLSPVSPTAMPLVLFMIEIIGSIVSLPLMYLSLKGFWENKNNKKKSKT